MNPVKLRKIRIGRHITALDNTIRAENLDDMLLGEITSEPTDKDPGRWFGRLDFLLLLPLLPALHQINRAILIPGVKSVEEDTKRIFELGLGKGR